MEQASPEQVAEAATYARSVAENDPIGREAQKVIEEQLHARYGIDLRQTATEGTGGSAGVPSSTPWTIRSH